MPESRWNSNLVSWTGVVALLLAAAAAPPSRAGIDLSLTLGDVAGEDWQVEGVALAVASDAPGEMALEITVEQAQLPGQRAALRNLRLACALLLGPTDGWVCTDGRLSVEQSPAGPQKSSWHGTFQSTQSWRLEIPELSLGSGKVSIALRGAPTGWVAEVQPLGIPIERLGDIEESLRLPEGWQVQGRLSGRVKVRGDAGIDAVESNLLVERLNYASPDATQAGEAVILKGDLNASQKAGDWSFNLQLNWPQGGVYSEPLFYDAGSGMVAATATGIWQDSARGLAVQSWTIDLGKAVQLAGTGSLNGAWQVQDLTVAARSDDAGLLYTTLLQPFLIGTAADELEMQGRVGFALHLDAAGVDQLGLDLTGLQMADRKGRFTLGRTDGSIAWDRRKTVPISQLKVADASIYRIPIDAFDIRVHFAGDTVRLTEPITVPVLGGQVALDQFELSGALVAGAKPEWRATASVRNVSLDQLTAALGWQPFGGTVQGQLRDMHYRDQVFAVGGGLTLNAFDGAIRVNDLQIREPLGSVPILTADVAFQGLNLEALTSTFSFGRIEGRLDGTVDDLQLVAWQPNRFALHFHTPPDDDTRRRISQRAVENLTELGSGVPAGLSTTVLSVFDEFRYALIDLKINLQGDVAQIDGLARPDGGYYLVKGSGLPRIDVIGRNRSVAWKDLVERLQQIQVEGAQIR